MTKTALCLLGLSCLLIGCTNVDPGGEGHGGPKSAPVENVDDSNFSQLYKTIKSEIGNFGQQHWDKSAYLQLRDADIATLTQGIENQTAQDKLEVAYCQVIIRDTKEIYASGCPNRSASHALLDTLYAELGQHDRDAAGRAEVERLRRLHKEVDGFLPLADQSPSSYRASYDMQYERNKMSKAQAYLNNPEVKCLDQREQLEKLTSPNEYQGRRNNFRDKIVKHYKACTNPAESEYNAALSAVESAGSDYSKWTQQIDAHYQELNTPPADAQNE